MSVPVPSSSDKKEAPAARRLSTGNFLDAPGSTSEAHVVPASDLTEAVSKSSMPFRDHRPPENPAESPDEDFNRRMRNMTLIPEPAPPRQPCQQPINYPTYSISYGNYPQTPIQPVYSPMPPPFPHYPSQPPFYEHPNRPDYPLDALQHSYAAARALQSSSPSAYSISPHPSTTPRPYGWGSPPMTPAISTVPFGGIGELAGPGRGLGDGSVGSAGFDEYGRPNQMMMYSGAGHHPAQWVTPAPSSPYSNYTPFQHVDAPLASPTTPQGFQHRGPWTGPHQRPPYATGPNRTSWIGPVGAESQRERERERKAYHPQPPARRSDWVMWVGNVPSNTSHEELWRYFNSNAPALPGDADRVEWNGPSSIFLISRSQCAFVNLSCQTDLDRAVRFFNGRPLRPLDPKCPGMVCRVRRKDDDLKAGVGAQRGTGMHREWIKAQGGNDAELSAPVDTRLVPPPSDAGVGSAKTVEPLSPAALEPPPEGEGRRRESIVNANDAKHQSSASMASTNSSFLVRHFPKRYFILKSLTTVELEDSVQSGTWKTQRHNEPILDQAFRTAQEVILVFSANKSGEFFGYAKMIEPIDKEKAAAKAAKAQRPGRLGSHSSGSIGSGGSGSIPLAKSTPQTEPITEEDETEPIPQRPQWLQSQSSQRFAASSPGQLTPRDMDSETDELDRHRRGERRTESPQPVGMGSLGAKPALTVSQRAQTLSPSAHPTERANETMSFFDLPVPQASREDAADKQVALGGSSRPADIDVDGILRKDTALTPGERAHREESQPQPVPVQDGFAPDDWGQAFRIEWVRVGNLPFHRIRHLRNPWNADREIKVSRDGTEVEPTTAATLLTEWDRMGFGPNFSTVQEYSQSPLEKVA